jgi:hypothetical protein
MTKSPSPAELKYLEDLRSVCIEYDLLDLQAYDFSSSDKIGNAWKALGVIESIIKNN